MHVPQDLQWLPSIRSSCSLPLHNERSSPLVTQAGSWCSHGCSPDGMVRGCRVRVGAGQAEPFCGLQPASLCLGMPSLVSFQWCWLLSCWTRAPKFCPQHFPALTLCEHAGWTEHPVSWPLPGLLPPLETYFSPILPGASWISAFGGISKLPGQYLRKSLKEKQEKQNNNCSCSPQPWVAGGTIPQTCINILGKEHEAQPPARPGGSPGAMVFSASYHGGGQIAKKRWCESTAQKWTRLRPYPQGGCQPSSLSAGSPRHPVLWQFTRPPAPESLLDCSDAHQRREPQLLAAWGWLAQLDRFCLAQHRGQTAMVFGLDPSRVFLSSEIRESPGHISLKLMISPIEICSVELCLSKPFIWLWFHPCRKVTRMVQGTPIDHLPRFTNSRILHHFLCHHPYIFVREKNYEATDQLSKSGDLTLTQYNHLTHCTYSHFINRPPGSFHSILPPRTHTYPHASFPCLFSFFNPKQFLIFLSSPWPWPFWGGKGSYFQKCLHLCLFVLSQDQIQAVFFLIRAWGNAVSSPSGTGCPVLGQISDPLVKVVSSRPLPCKITLFLS